MTSASLLLPIIALLQPAPPKLSAELYAAHAALRPGGETELAIVLRVAKDWHTHHSITLDTGAPTSIRFAAPPTVTFGELRFPVPVLGETAGLEYLALEGEFVVLTTVKLSADAGEQPITLTAQVYALVCKELCLPVEAEATLTLPVTAAPPAAANEKLFEDARAALPARLEKAPYLEGSRVSVSKDRLGLEDEAEVVFQLRIKKGHHIQDPNPGVEALIPSRVFVEPLNGLKFEDPRWPEPKVKDMPPFGRVREQSGDVTVRVPFRINDRLMPSGPVALRVLVTYQSCSDAGVCYPPETAESVVRFVVDTPNPPATAPLGTLQPAIVPPGTGAPTAAGVAREPTPARSLLTMLVLGLVGGLILNVMPCVFPVISLKILGFVKQAGEDRGRVLRLGLAFCAGILAWFWIFALLTSLGQIPWQHPPVVVGLSAIVFLFALNLFGVYEIVLPGAAAGKLDEVAGREGYPGAFLKGLLATLLGTACTAPFFATAAAFAATQPRHVGFAVFTSAGVGMSLPYLLLAAFPSWLRALPRPGAWMVVFKQVMGFVLVGTAIWLLLIVGDLLDARGVVWTVAFWAFLSVSAWLIGRIGLNWTAAGRAKTWLAALVIAAFGWWFSLERMYDWRAALEQKAAGPASRNLDPDAIIAAVAASDWNDHIPWQPWRPGLPEELARRGYTVYVDFTATWCITCQTNKATAIDITSTRARMRQLGVIPLQADYTLRNAAIHTTLLTFGHPTVPLNLIYPASRPDEVIQLPVLLTPGIVAEALGRAGPSVSRVAADRPRS